MTTFKRTSATIVLGAALTLGSAFSIAMTGSVKTIPPAPVNGADSALKAPPFVVAPESGALALKAPPFVVAPESGALAM